MKDISLVLGYIKIDHPLVGLAKLPRVAWLNQLERPKEQRNENNHKMQPWPISKVGLVILIIYCSRFNLNLNFNPAPVSPPAEEAERDNIALYNDFFKTQEVPADKVSASTTVTCSKPTKYCLSLIPQVEVLIPAAFQAIQDLLYTSPAKSPESKVWFDPFFPQVEPVAIILDDWSADPKAGKVLGETSSPILGPMEVRIDTWFIRTSKEYRFLGFNFGASTEQKIASTLFHELVHVFQHRFPRPESLTHHEAYKALHRVPPRGLLEGIADFVPLMVGRDWPAAKRPRLSRHLRGWDSGYEETALFLEWLELVRFGKGTVGMINDRILKVGYVKRGKDEFWKSLFGVSVKQLWKEYGLYVNRMGRCFRWRLPILDVEVDLAWARQWKWFRYMLMWMCILR